MRFSLALLPALLVGMVFIAGCTSTGSVTVTPPTTNTTTDTVDGDVPVPAAPPIVAVQEIEMDSFVVFENGKPKPQYSVKEITVPKGATVRLKINTTAGTHDFNIDEFNVHAATPTGEVTTVEFVADTAGEFVYYCSMPGHRMNGHLGTIRVV